VQPTNRPKNAVPIAELIGVELPPVPIIECLLETYIGSIHWYVTLFHEPTLRARLRALLASGRANADDFSFLMLIVIILGMAARYVSPQQMKQHGVEFNALALEAKLVAAAEQQLLQVLEDPTSMAVSFLDLLASHYLFNRKVRRAFVIMGVAMRAAQAMDLHNEPAWGDIPAVERECRRRLWWTLYTSEKYLLTLLSTTPSPHHHLHHPKARSHHLSQTSYLLADLGLSRNHMADPPLFKT